MAWPANGTAVIHSLNSGAPGSGKVAAVSLLGSSEAIRFEQTADALVLHLPPSPPTPFASSFKITFNQ